MTIKVPTDPAPLRRLWQQAFCDSDAFLDDFFAHAYSPDRCRCVFVDDRLAAMLYWFHCCCGTRRIAYLYAVATDSAFQGQGLCRALIADTHRHLQALGYDGCILVPGEPDLFAMYEKMGYRTCSSICEFSCEAGMPIPLETIDAARYAALRAHYLPEGGVVEEGAALRLLRTYASFYAGDSFVLAAHREGSHLTVCELLGNADAPGIVAALGCQSGTFRTPGEGRPFAMYASVTDAPPPAYFGLALD